MNTHSNANWNDKLNTSLHRSDFKEFFYILDKNLKDNRFVLVLEKLDKAGVYKQFDDKLLSTSEFKIRS